MQASELRIGNIVKDGMRYVTIDGLDMVRIIQCEIARKNAGYFPIPLTPEILLEKCGFTVITSSHKFPYFSISATVVLAVIGNETVHLVLSFIDEDWKLHDLGVMVYHLHQLQNLFYALTGQELVVNL